MLAFVRACVRAWEFNSIDASAFAHARGWPSILSEIQSLQVLKCTQTALRTMLDMISVSNEVDLSVYFTGKNIKHYEAFNMAGAPCFQQRLRGACRWLLNHVPKRKSKMPCAGTHLVEECVNGEVLHEGEVVRWQG